MQAVNEGIEMQRQLRRRFTKTLDSFDSIVTCVILFRVGFSFPDILISGRERAGQDTDDEVIRVLLFREEGMLTEVLGKYCQDLATVRSRTEDVVWVGCTVFAILEEPVGSVLSIDLCIVVFDVDTLSEVPAIELLGILSVVSCYWRKVWGWMKGDESTIEAKANGRDGMGCSDECRGILLIKYCLVSRVYWGEKDMEPTGLARC